MLIARLVIGLLVRLSAGGRTLTQWCTPPFVLAVALLATATWTGPALAGYAAVVVDADTGRVLHARNADTRNFPASLTKLMTLYLTFEALEAGTLTLDQKLPVSKRAAGQPPSRLGLAAGSTISLDDAIRALAVKSANDAATVIAEAIGGTEVKFALMMTERARAIGMGRTTFRNASGLPNRRQLSTARDMAVLAKAMIDRFPQYYSYFSEETFRFHGKVYRNHNRLLKNYEGADGIKTGYIRASGFNLVASAERDGHRLIGVVFGGRTAKRRDRHMQALLNRSWAKARATSTVAARPIPKPQLAVAAANPDTAAIPNIVPTKLQRAPTKWGIQVGAFEGYGSAHTAAGDAARRLAGLPATASLEIQPVEQSDNTLFRARLMGMDETSARSACRQLRQTGAACSVITPNGDAQLAGIAR